MFNACSTAARPSWRPDASAYAALDALYIDHNDFRGMYDTLHLRLAPFLAGAMSIYTQGMLGAGQA